MKHYKHNAEYDPAYDYEEDDSEEEYEEEEMRDVPDPDYEAEWEKEYDAYCDWLDNSGRPVEDQR